MAEILVGNQVCASCGAEIRPGAVFCYNCGGEISAVPQKSENNNGNGISAKIPKRNNSVPTQLKEKKADEATTEISGFETTIDRKNDKPNLPAKTDLKSAAAMRRKPKASQKKEVQIVWEEQESPSSLLLIATALLLAIFAAAVVIIAMTLK